MSYVRQAAALRSDNRSGYKGVTAQDGRYRAHAPEDAARAYDVAALELGGPDAWTNEAKGGAAR